LWRIPPRHPLPRRLGVRIVLADDNKEIRSALGLLLEESLQRTGGNAVPSPFSLVEAANADALILRLKEGMTDAVLLDWELPGLPPAELLAEVRKLSPHCAVVAMSGRPEARRHSLSLGVDGFVSKNEPPDKLLELLGLTQPHNGSWERRLGR
jgi:DNA-binding NarL/FixJ family response regulator